MITSISETSPSTSGRILAGLAFMGVALFAIVGVIATSGWLFVRGVDDAKWGERAALAAASIWR